MPHKTALVVPLIPTMHSGVAEEPSHYGRPLVTSVIVCNGDHLATTIKKSGSLQPFRMP